MLVIFGLKTRSDTRIVESNDPIDYRYIDISIVAGFVSARIYTFTRFIRFSIARK